MITILPIAEPDALIVLAARLAAQSFIWDGRDSPAVWRHSQRCTRHHWPTQTLKPRGEVYSKDWTPAHWKSFSEASR